MCNLIVVSYRTPRRGMIGAALLLSLHTGGTTPPAVPESVLPCVPCHHREDRNQVGEWLASPYSETAGGRSCPECHGPSCSGFVEVSEFPAGRSAGPRESARLTVTAVCAGDFVEAEVAVSNVGAGHLLPTGRGAPGLLLEVAAHDRDLSPLPLRAGSRRRLVPRLLPFATDVSRSRFGWPGSGPAHVTARLDRLAADGTAARMAVTETLCKIEETQ